MGTPNRRRSGLFSALVAALLATAGLSAGATLPASAAPPTVKAVSTYVALGDSYAAGQGGGEYLNQCYQTEASYPALLDEDHLIKLLRNVTCAGATTLDVQTDQIRSLNPGVKLVTVTIGGNDLDVTGLAAACAVDPSSAGCVTAVLTRQAALPALLEELRDTYAAIAAAAPRATILVTGYPPLVGSDPIHGGTLALNATIRTAVLQVAATGVDIRYVDIAGPFTGHGLDSGADSWFVFAGADALHPSASGYRAYAAAIRAAI